MSYANRRQLNNNRTVPIIFSAVITFALGYALVSGLAYSVVKNKLEDLKTFDVNEPPPPPEEKPPPPEKTDIPPPPQISAPPPLVRMETPAPPISTTPVINTTPPITTVVTKAPPAPAGPPPVVNRSAQAKGDVRTLFSEDDYPASALDAGISGTGRAILTIGTDGRVTGCSMAQSTGNGALDSATCNVLRRRAKFTPAVDSAGNPTTGSYTTPSITWRPGN